MRFWLLWNLTNFNILNCSVDKVINILAETFKLKDMEKIKIELREWDYECGDRCCYDWGVKLYMNGKELEHPEHTKDEHFDNSRLGEDTPNAIKAILKELGYEVEIIQTYEE